MPAELTADEARVLAKFKLGEWTPISLTTPEHTIMATLQSDGMLNHSNFNATIELANLTRAGALALAAWKEKHDAR